MSDKSKWLVTFHTNDHDCPFTYAMYETEAEATETFLKQEDAMYLAQIMEEKL